MKRHPSSHGFEHPLPSWWRCFGRLWNLEEVEPHRRKWLTCREALRDPRLAPLPVCSGLPNGVCRVISCLLLLLACGAFHSMVDCIPSIPVPHKPSRPELFFFFFFVRHLSQRQKKKKSNPEGNWREGTCMWPLQEDSELVGSLGFLTYPCVLHILKLWG